EYRRRVMDAALSQVSPSYFFALTRYTRVVRQRNRLLRAAADGAALAPWDEQLVDLGAVVIERRREFVARLGVRAAARPARLAEVDLLKEERGEWPVVLFDDVLAHLDAARQALLVREIAGPQVLLTHTERPALGAAPMRVLRVRTGRIVEESGVSA